jgi:hypothetical protein
MGRFETPWLAAPRNLAALADLSGQWIDLVHDRRPPRGIVLDMDSSPTHGEQEMSVWDGHYDWYAIRLPANRILQIGPATCSSARSGDLQTRSAGSILIFTYQAGSWTKPRRVIAKVEWHPGELFPRVGFIVTNLSRPAERVVVFYNKRGTCEQWIKEGKRVDPAIVPLVRRQRRSAPASCTALQSRQFPTHPRDARADEGLVADEPEGETDQDRREGHQPRLLCRLPDGRGAPPRQMFQEILRLIAELRPQPPPAPA